MQLSDAFQAALAILAQDPLPSDAGQQLAALEAEIEPEEADMFGALWEAYYAAGGQDL